jgi:hypothetical protein
VAKTLSKLKRLESIQCRGAATFHEDSDKISHSLGLRRLDSWDEAISKVNIRRVLCLKGEEFSKPTAFLSVSYSDLTYITLEKVMYTTSVRSYDCLF